MSYILLSSAKNDLASSRSFNKFADRADLAQTIIAYFEEWLLLEEKCKYPELNNENSCLEYNSDDLFNFMDNFFGELVCLVREDDTSDLWIPYSIDWVKEAIYMYLRGQSEKKPVDDQSGPSVIDIEMDEGICS